MKNKGVLAIRYGLLFLAAAFLITGVCREEYVGVLQKAVNICLECIGIG